MEKLQNSYFFSSFVQSETYSKIIYYIIFSREGYVLLGEQQFTWMDIKCDCMLIVNEQSGLVETNNMQFVIIDRKNGF